MKKLAILFLMLIGPVLNAEPLEDAVSILDPILKPYVKSLSREIVLYHYSRRDQMGLGMSGYIDSKDPRRITNIMNRMERFWNLNENISGVAGNGLYAALDPYSTESYGGGNFGLYIITLKAGTKFLDKRGTSDYKNFDFTIVSKLRSLGCNASNINSLFMTPGCVNYVRMYFNLKGITALVYSYSSFRPSFCEPLSSYDRSRGAWVLSDPDAIDLDKTFVITNDVPQDTEAREARDRYLMYKFLSSSNNFQRQYAESQLKDWAMVHHFACGKYPEDEVPQ